MFWITYILLFLSGVAAASKFLIERFPQWKLSLIKIDTFKGILGFLVLVLGLGKTIDFIFGLGHPFKGEQLLTLLLMLALGIIQGLGILKQILSEDNIGYRNLLKMRSKVAPYEEMIGLVALITALIAIIRIIF